MALPILISPGSCALLVTKGLEVPSSYQMELSGQRNLKVSLQEKEGEEEV